jgi:hypothetical protein
MSHGQEHPVVQSHDVGLRETRGSKKRVRRSEEQSRNRSLLGSLLATDDTVPPSRCCRTTHRDSTGSSEGACKQGKIVIVEHSRMNVALTVPELKSLHVMFPAFVASYRRAARTNKARCDEAKKVCGRRASLTRSYLLAHHHSNRHADDRAWTEAEERQTDAEHLCRHAVTDVAPFWEKRHELQAPCECGECEAHHRIAHFIRHYVPSGTVNRAKVLLYEKGADV